MSDSREIDLAGLLHAKRMKLTFPPFRRQSAPLRTHPHLPSRPLTSPPAQINQTGDLTNLSGLPTSESALLPTLIQLRDALYSPTFRSFIRSVTGCGPLSGIKTDMSCAEYSQGCYLLNHDDVIGTRRISFILYLVLDESGAEGTTAGWREEWGGALQLYPVQEGEGARPNVPEQKPTLSVPVRGHPCVRSAWTIELTCV